MDKNREYHCESNTEKISYYSTYEATSSLDADSEEIVQNAILNLIKNKTTLVIAHRLSTIHNANKIFVLKHGKIINEGNHQYLINNCNEYISLYKKQLK